MPLGETSFEQKGVVSRIDAELDSSSTRLGREANLLADTGRGAANRAKELMHHPGELSAELAGSALVGMGLALAQGRAGLLREGVQVVGAAMATSFALDSGIKVSFAKDAAVGAWSGQSFGAAESRTTGDTIGAFLVDSAVMSAGGFAGVKAGRNSSVFMGFHRGVDKLRGIDVGEQHSQLRTQMLAYHPLTAHHQDRVGALSLMIAENLRMPPGAVEMSYRAGQMHDIGKLRTPLEILDFPGKLEGHEREVMNHHATDTGVILRDQVTYPSRLTDLPTVAENHHERLDGLGSPNALTADQIAPETRVNTVADVFDVLAHSRSYKSPTPINQLLEIMDRGRGKQFDGTVLDALYRQPATKVLPLMLADGSAEAPQNPPWLSNFKGVKIGDLLESVKLGSPVVGSSVTPYQIRQFNLLYDNGHQGI